VTYSPKSTKSTKHLDLDKDRETEEEIDAAAVYGEGLTPDQLFDKVIDSSNTLVWIANWCTIDLRIGVIFL
jgi:hypothetical protein